MDVQKRRPQGGFWLRRLLLVGLLLCVFTGLGFTVSYLTDVEPVVSRETLVIDEVRFGVMVHEIRGVGKLTAEKDRIVPARTAGRVIEILVLPGVEVTHETQLMTLTNPDLSLAAAEAKSALDVSRAELKTQRANLEGQLRVLQSNEVLLESSYQQAKAELEVTEALAERNIEPPHKVRIRRIASEGLQKQLLFAKQSLNQFEASLDDHLAAYKERINQAEAKLQLAQSKVASLVVTAGFDGVLSELPVEAGQQVTAGEVLAKLVDPRKLKAELRIPEVQARYVQRDQIARIDTHFGIVEGRVSRLDPSVQDGTLSIDVTFDVDLPADTRPDLSVNGMVEVGRLDNVLHAGRPFGVMADSDVQLFRVDGSRQFARRVSVAVGAASIHEVEIRAGLAEGDLLVVSNMSDYDDRDRIRLE